jgi:uncharacterized protein YdiU (UPF0061 family)
MRAKLGLPAGLDDAVVAPIVDGLLELAQRSHVDHTSLYRALSAAARGDTEPARGLFLDLGRIDEWLATWRALDPDPDAMDRTNPVHVPRNHLVEEALDAAIGGDLDPVRDLVDVLTSPFHTRPGLERYAAPAPDDFGAYRTYCGT